MIVIAVANEQSGVPVDAGRLRRAVRAILKDHGIQRGRISVAVVDDATIARLHQQYLQDPSPTDVLSFPLESAEGYVEAEVVVGGQRAAAVAPEYGRQAEEELLRYVIHGTLHLVGYDDRLPRERARMRRAERAYLARCGVPPG